jgi:MFS family permease
MRLSGKDVIAVLATAFVILMIGAGLGGLIVDNPTSWRAATLLLIALGLGVYAVLGPRFLPTKEPWFTISATLHMLAGVLAVIALISGQKIVFVILAFVLAALWIIATTHHIYLKNYPSRRVHKRRHV